MVDKISKERRSENMRAIRSVSKLENEVTKRLWASGLRFRKNIKNMPGKPDIVIKKYRVVIFIDSCFWHNCPVHGTFPKSNASFWKEKLERNVMHDIKINEYYTHHRWHLYRVWEHDLRNDFTGTLRKISMFIEKAKTENNPLNNNFPF